MLARTFGCARVVFNDALALRDQAHKAGKRLSDSEIQTRVITDAKHTDERAWLGEVASVALVQACQDARTAYRNWFDSMSGVRKGRKVGHPRFRRQSGRLSVRLTRNGSTLHDNGRVYLAKVGDVRVRWSQSLPSEPSSVTVIREPDGRYYLSFVVERETQPLPVIGREAGIDLGLDRLVVTSDGEVTANPRFFRKRLRRLAYLQRSASRKQKGSANRRKANHRVAVQHRKVRDARLDHAHKTALRLVRENQRSTPKTWPYRVLRVPGWPSRCTTQAGRNCFAWSRRSPATTGGRSIRSAGSSRRLRCALNADGSTGLSR